MWLHCNKCGVCKSENNTVKFFVGVCCHVLCGECNRSGTCSIHKRPFNGTEVKNSMPQKLRMYFEDPNFLLKHYQKCIRFQCEQRTLYESHEWKNAYTENIRKCKQQLSVLERYKALANKDIEKRKNDLNKIKAYIRNFEQKYQAEEYVGSHSTNTTATSSTLSARGLNASNELGESGVDMDFDYLNNSN